MIRSIATLSLLAVTAAFAPSTHFMQGPAAEPGAEHADLAKLAGDWSVVTTFSFGAGKRPQEFHGEAHGKMMLGGRFLQFDESAVEFGKPVERQKTWGYNTTAKTYESTWRYTGATATMNFTGTSSDGGKTIAGDASFAGEDSAPQKFTWQMKVIDADHFTNTLVSPAHGGRPAPTFEAVYTRVAKK